MPRLSSPLDQLNDKYEVVVVGSGYGGGIAASRLSRAGFEVCLLERGKEKQPGEYPDTVVEATEEMQIDTPDIKVGSKTGMFNFHVNKEMNVLVGCGLGGTSLINANVSLKAEPRVFDDPRWPDDFRESTENGGGTGGGVLIEKCYEQVMRMLKPTPYPEDFPALDKLNANEASANGMGEKFYRPPLNVTFQDPPGGVNHVGVEQKACVNCGDCVTGCNHKAKNTTLMNYLPDAFNHGAKIFTEISVRYLERDGDRWRVHCEILGAGRPTFNAPDFIITAGMVVIAAGTLGSTEIMLRSRDKGGVSVSNMLGKRFTGNGDVLGFAYNNDRVINGIGFGHHNPKGRKPVGPTITSIIDMREQPKLAEGCVVEEGAVPGALSPMLPAFLSVAAGLGGTDTDHGFIDAVNEKMRVWDSTVRGAYQGAVHNTQTFLVMGHDSASGVMSLDASDRLTIDWPGVGDEPTYVRANQKLYEATVPLGGTFVKNPIWSKLFKQSLVTVHPLGGCVMGRSAVEGVVNHKNQVFSGANGQDVYDNLYVCDGAAIPCPVGVNPLLTISAVAERACIYMAKDRNKSFNYDLPSAPPSPPPPAKPGIRFTETMTGYWTRGASDFKQGFEDGKRNESLCEFTLTITTNDLADMIDSPEHQAELTGTLLIPVLSADPMSVTDGVFNLFTEDSANVDARNMFYRMRIRSDDGTPYFFKGYKVVKDRPTWDAWQDTTTLFVTLYEGDDDKGKEVGRGILHIKFGDFLKQLTTMDVFGVDGVQERLTWSARFGKFFAGIVFDHYGGIFMKDTEFASGMPARKKRPLRCGPPEVHPVKTEDGFDILLTRYRGGDKGPVVLVHGLGVSSLIFSIDTIETNLLEFLYAHGYDVWLADLRFSIALPASKRQTTGDESAQYDYPAVIQEVQRVTGAQTAQMVVHCWGSSTFFMSMLGGLTGVRSIVCSQIATDAVAPTLTKFKTGLHIPSVLESLGIKTLSAVPGEKWYEKLFDASLRLQPTPFDELCKSPVCHRITFLYGLLYEHEQLNQATHDALHEMFGAGNIETFEQLARIVRTGHSVAADGSEAYMPHFDRLGLPIAFIHGGLNSCYLPESTQITYDRLRAMADPKLYDRIVVPGYGHIDCIFGKNAVDDVYPFIVRHLDAHQV